MLYEELRNITANELNSAVQDLKVESKYPHEDVQVTLSCAREFPILDQVVKTLQKIGKSPDSTPEALARIEGMRIIFASTCFVCCSKEKQLTRRCTQSRHVGTSRLVVAALLLVKMHDKAQMCDRACSTEVWLSSSDY